MQSYPRVIIDYKAVEARIDLYGEDPQFKGVNI